ncbi:hypothetical protein DRP04_00155 [Archaeoglobales archaeon]|nr:MAG: hypothetical protein DRP04_00155 [Archaeoglobales archaeon]
MNEYEACRKWLRCDFSSIPTGLLEKAYGPTFDDIIILAPTLDDYKKEYIDDGNCDGDCESCTYRECEDSYYEDVPKIPSWGWVFVPREGLDARWIRNNARDIYNKCGIIVYETDEIGVFLGINGAGYDFYKVHWLPLYRLRGLKWHEG